MIRGFLIGILAIALAFLLALACYAGALALLIRPGEVRAGGGFTIQRAQYLDTPQGRSYPASIVIGSDAVTYTFVVSK